MLKRLSEKTSLYNVNQFEKDYEISQYYKKNHCLHPPINFSQFKKNNFTNKIKLTRKNFFSKTHYTSTGKLNYVPFPSVGFIKRTRIKKKFEDFSYRDLNLDDKNKSDIKNDKEKEKPFKKISEFDNEKKEKKNNNISDNIIKIKVIKKEEKKEEIKEEKNEEKKENDNNGIKEQKQKNRDDKKEREEKKEVEKDKKE